MCVLKKGQRPEGEEEKLKQRNELRRRRRRRQEERGDLTIYLRKTMKKTITGTVRQGR